MNDIKIICKKLSGETYDITNILVKAVWSGNIKACSRKLEFSCLNDVDMPLSSLVMAYVDNVEIFRGFIYEREKDSKDVVSYLAFDYAEKLNKIKVSYNLKGQNGYEIANKILSDYKFEIRSLAKASAKNDKIFMNNTIYECIMSAYTLQSKQDNKKYMITCEQGKISVTEKGIVKLKVAFEEAKNVINSSFKESVVNMINKVLIVDEQGNNVSQVADSEMAKMHGLFQEVYKQEEGKDANVEAKKLLKGVEQTCSLNGFGDITCLTGYGVNVKDTNTGLVGHFYIDGDTHTWEKGKYNIDLDLNFNNIMDEVEAGEDEQKEESSSEIHQDFDVVGGTEVPAEFTAYYPANDSMQGGFKDAMGNRLDASKLTCAAPKQIDFLSKIQVRGTGTDRDGLVYTVTDRGGAIKIVNGVYKIDLLMSNKKEAYAFGRRKGKALINCGVINNTKENSNVKGYDIIQKAKSKLGCKYVWGATGPNEFDCSGLTQWCHKQVGISIPRTSSQQRGAGKKLSKENAQLGDIVCFDGHVGLYAGNGKMIHAPNKNKPVKYDNCFSGYWGKKLLAIRRYW